MTVLFYDSLGFNICQAFHIPVKEALSSGINSVYTIMISYTPLEFVICRSLSSPPAHLILTIHVMYWGHIIFYVWQGLKLAKGHNTLFMFMEFSRQEYWSGLPFPPPVDHTLELSTMTHPSWVALYGMAHSFIELCKPLRHDKAVIQEGERLKAKGEEPGGEWDG